MISDEAEADTRADARHYFKSWRGWRETRPARLDRFLMPPQWWETRDPQICFIGSPSLDHDVTIDRRNGVKTVANGAGALLTSAWAGDRWLNFDDVMENYWAQIPPKLSKRWIKFQIAPYPDGENHLATCREVSARTVRQFLRNRRNNRENWRDP